MKGIYIKVLIALCGLIAANIGICVNTVGVFNTTVSAHLGVLTGTFIIASTLLNLTYAVAGLFTWKVMNRHNFKKLIMTGVIICAVTSMMQAFGNQIWHFYVLAVIRGIGMCGFSMIVVSNIINHWYNKNHGLITCLIMSFSGAVAAILSPVFTYVIENFSWQAGYLMQGGMIFICAVPCFLLDFTMDPKDMGLLPYGGLKQEVSMEEKEDTTGDLKGIGYLFVVVCIINLTSALSQHLPAMAISRGFTLAIGGFISSASMIGNILSKLIFGAASDRFGVVKSALVTYFVAMCGMLTLIFGGGNIILAGGFMFGFIFALSGSGTMLFTHYFYEKQYQKVYPLMSFVASFVFAFAGSIEGYIYDFTHTYLYIFIGLVVLGLFACVMLVKQKKAAI